MHPYFQPLAPEGLYHIYNRGNNGENLFFEAKNYGYFLKKLHAYLSPCLQVYAYCLLPNHFHLLVKLKNETAIQDAALLLGKLKPENPPGKMVSELFRRFFLSYAKSIKIQEGRTGSLFEKNFRRKPVEDDRYTIRLINYIHRNPETHGLVANFRNYPHSSYAAILSDAPTRLQREAVLDLFGGKEAFVSYHDANTSMRFEEAFD